MEFFNQAIDILKILVMALGAGLAVWGVINLLEGYGSDNPAANVLVLLKIGTATGSPPAQTSGQSSWGCSIPSPKPLKHCPGAWRY